MPEFHCPRCNATLREEDCLGWIEPYEPAWDRHTRLTIRFYCWACTWSSDICVKTANKTDEVELPA